MLNLSNHLLGINGERDIVGTINKLGAECLHQDTRLVMRAAPT